MTNKHGLIQITWICPPGGGRGVKQGSPRAWWTKGSRRWTLQSGVSLADCPPMSFSIVCWQGLPPPTQQIKIKLQTSWGGRYNRGWAETSNGEKVWISKLFDTMNKLWKEEKAKVGDIFDNRNSGIIWKSRLLWWCIIDDPQPYWCLGKIWKFGWGSHFKRRIVCKSWLMRRWARCWKRGRVSTRRLTLGINQLLYLYLYF